MSKFLVIASEPVVKDVTGPVSPAVDKILKESDVLETMADDKYVYWADVKKEYPELEQQIKPVFKGKDKIAVKDLKELVLKVPTKEASFWLSNTTWDAADLQRELSRKNSQTVVQLNIGKEIVEAIKNDEVLDRFYREVSQTMSSQSLHPTHSQTIAWARVYKMADKYIIEEVQSDIFGPSVKLKDLANSNMERILEKFTPGEQKRIEDFFHSHFVDWDKKLVASIISMARRDGVPDVWMFDMDMKKGNKTSKSKLEKFYKVLPRDLGFKRDSLEIEDSKITGWRRAVASVQKGNDMSRDLMKALARVVKAKDDGVSVIEPKGLKQKPGQALDDGTKRVLLTTVYDTILNRMGKENQLPMFKQAIKQMPAHEIEMEWKAIEDGTVSRIIKMMLKGVPEEHEQDFVAIWEGLAKPYFRDYKGNVPKEDLEWAHKEIKDFLDKVEGTPPKQLKGNDQKRIKACRSGTARRSSY